MMNERTHPIRAVAQRTGLSSHVIRVWERRYGAVAPKRTASNRRLYTDRDIERLLLLRKVTDAGYSIGQVAGLSDTELLELLGRSDRPAVQHAPRDRSSSTSNDPEPHLAACIAAAENLDAGALEIALTNASVALSRPLLLEGVLIPLMARIGDGWQKGTIRTVHEHLASSVVRSVLGSFLRSNGLPGSAPEIIVTTPAGQLHEFGALIASATALSTGWKVTYLGPNLPAEEIAAAARQNGARIIALSIIFPPDDPGLIDEIRNIRRMVGDETTILVGGRSAPSYRDVLNDVGAVSLNDMKAFRKRLEEERTRMLVGIDK